MVVAELDRSVDRTTSTARLLQAVVVAAKTSNRFDNQRRKCERQQLFDAVLAFNIRFSPTLSELCTLSYDGNEYDNPTGYARISLGVSAGIPTGLGPLLGREELNEQELHKCAPTLTTVSRCKTLHTC